MWDAASACSEKPCVGARPGSEPGPQVAERVHLTDKPRGRPKVHFKFQEIVVQHLFHRKDSRDAILALWCEALLSTRCSPLESPW